MRFLVVRHGEIVGQDLTKSKAVEVALHHNGIKTKIEHDGNGRHYLWLSWPNDQFYKTVYYSNHKDREHIVTELHEKLYEKRNALNLHIYTPEQYTTMYKTIIF